MSLYESLTRVLAPFAERLNGLLTGYDGTTYSTPGEAVRSQISDLHVLIGDEPGTAIAGSAVSYDGTESGMTATNMQGAVDELSGDISSTNERLLNAFPVNTVSGSVVTFDDGADGVPLKSLVIDINPIQDTSQGDPSPTNICPISGWTSVDVEQSGVNVWDEEWEVGGYAGSTGAAWDTNTRIRSKTTNYISVLPNTTYYVNMPSGTSMYLDIMFYNAGKTFISSTNPNAGTTFTTPSDARFMRFASGAAYGTTYNHDISINYPSTDHDYHEGHVQSITIALGQTVYGGKLDVLSGELVIDYAKITIDGSSTIGRTGSAVSSPVLIQVIPPAQDIAFVDEKTIPWCLCGSYLPPTTAYGIYRSADLCIAINQAESRTSRRIWMRLPEVTTEAQAKTYLTDNPIDVVYPIYNPLTVQLTPHEVTALLGSNNVWADSGDSTVEYRADPTLYITRKIAEAVSALS